MFFLNNVTQNQHRSDKKNSDKNTLLEQHVVLFICLESYVSIEKD